MAAIVSEIMNRELFSVRPSDTAEATLGGILALGITAAPVLDEAGRPLGVVSLRDLTAATARATAWEKMSSPAVVIRARARIGDAARLIGETGYRHLVVVDENGHAVGMLSAVDAIRGLLGLPARHPAAFPHLDAKTGLQWTDDALLDEDDVDIAPDGPGILQLLYSLPGVPDSVVWVESAHNVRTRLLDILSLPQESPELRRLCDLRKDLRFRAAAVSDPEARERITGSLREEARHAPRPGVGWADPCGRRRDDRLGRDVAGPGGMVGPSGPRPAPARRAHLSRPDPPPVGGEHQAR